ncbi:MMPL family transporter [Actinophytocola xanthii]|uniref:MMPL family transporter n=1 Tax=Actinophytocola xanthii TaxID=1912961 RepID=UPI000A687C6E|nr:MMPL family transporter [Actinophytocola xanthii]
MAGWSQRHHWRALLLWLLVTAGVTAVSQVVGSDYRDDHSLPGTESARVAEALAEQAPRRSGDSVQIVLEGDLRGAEVERRLAGLVAQVAALPRVDAVQERPTVAEDGRIGFLTMTLDGQAGDVPAEDVRRIIDTAKAAEGDGLRVELGGDAVRGAEEGAGGAAEGAGMLAALVILVFMFGSLLAAALPLVTALFAVGSTLGVIMLASWLVDLPSYAPPLMMLVGLGVGIDYALLIFSRFRGELRRGGDRTAAARTALSTAGRSVLFAGCTVMIALLGLLALGLGSLRGVALAVSLTVLVTMVASITLLPALLTLFGPRIERAVLRGRRGDGDRWRRWAGVVQRRPWPVLVVSFAALVGLSLPTLGMHLGFADAGTESPASTSRQAHDLLAEGFGPGVNGPLVAVAQGDRSALDALAEAVAATEGVARVGEPQESGELGLLLVYPRSSPQDAATNELVTRLRTEVLPPLAERTGATYLLGGSTAAADDFAAAVGERLPLFVLVVVGLSALLLVVVFRSVLVPLKAAVLNLLSIGASLGVVTLVFQEGWFGAQPGPVEAFVPVMIFAIVFGLSMDYEVFLVSRMHEEWRRSGDASRAVREGLAATGGVITAAAAIMVVVFGAFLLSPDRMLRQFGLGLAVAVLVDALVIRCLVVPAVMRVLGARAWWLPRGLERRLPHVPLEGDRVTGR